MNNENKYIDDNEILLGEDKSTTQRIIAVLAILVVYFFYCYNFMLGTFVRPTMIKAIDEGGFGFDLTQASSIFAVLSFGTIPGTLFFGWLTSRLGKKNTLIIIAISFAVMTFVPLLNTTSLSLWRAARLMAGFCLGGVFGTAIPLVIDMFQPRYRGKLAALCTSMFSIAIIFAGWLYGILGNENWRILVYTAIVPPLIGAVLIYFLVPNDREQTLQKQKESIEKKGERINYFSMYKGKYLFIGIGVIFLSGMNFTGYSAFSNNSTTYLTTVLGLSAVTAGAIYSLQGVGQLVGYYLWGFIADKFGRKVPAIGMLLCAVVVFIYTRLGPESVETFKIISIFFGLFVGFSGAWGAYYTELFPKRFSGLSAGISFNGGRIISSFALPMVAGVAATSLGMVGIFFVVMAIFIIGSFIWLFLPETLHREREE